MGKSYTAWNNSITALVLVGTCIHELHSETGFWTIPKTS
jgi:hypothetical protein